MIDETLTVALDSLAAPGLFEHDWEDVLSRARGSVGSDRQRLLFTKRRGLFAVAVIVALLVPLVALSATRDWHWWFFNAAPSSSVSAPSTVGGDVGKSVHVRNPVAPLPAPMAGGPVVIAAGSWSGQSWDLVAYLSETDGVCFSVSPSETVHANGMGAGMNCDQIAGVPRTRDSKPATVHSITYLSGGRSPLLPGYIAGLVVGSATVVDVYLRNGNVIHADTIEGPSQLGAIRFYVAPLPDGVEAAPGQFVFTKLVGRDSGGDIVACFGAC
jgi:hypothetical protein